MEIKVINLDSRPDRWAEVLKELTNNGIESFQRFPGIKGGDKGCMLSHIELMKGEGSILVFEDDVIFEPDFNKNFIDYLFELPKDYDLFYLGANVKSPATRYSEHLWKVTEGVHCTHAMLYSAQGREKFNNSVNQILGCGLIDHWFYTEGLKLFNAFVANPLLAFQRSGYSDVRMQGLDYRGEMLENAKNNMQ